MLSGPWGVGGQPPSWLPLSAAARFPGRPGHGAWGLLPRGVLRDYPAAEAPWVLWVWQLLKRKHGYYSCHVFRNLYKVLQPQM